MAQQTITGTDTGVTGTAKLNAMLTELYSGVALMPVFFPAPGATVSVAGAVSVAVAGAQAVETKLHYLMTAAAQFTINTSTMVPGQAIRLIFGGAFAWNFTNAIAWGGQIAPVSQCSALLTDEILVEMRADGTLAGYVVGLGQGASTLTIGAFGGTITAGSTVTVNYTYTGTPPSNIDYSLGGGAFVPLAAGATSPTNGTGSFTITAPSATGPIVIRATTTGEVSPAVSLPISAATAPTGNTLGVSVGNASAVITGAVNLNGSNLTSVPVYRGIAASGEAATAIGTATISAGSGSYTYTDNTVVNGTKYYWTTNPTNGVGAEFASIAAAAAGAEVSGTPSAAVTAPTHFLTLSGTTSGAVGTGSTALNDDTTGYQDLRLYLNLGSYAPSAQAFLVSKWALSGSATAANSEFALILLANGTLNYACYNAAGAFISAVSSVTVASASPSATTGIWLRTVTNMTAAVVNGFAANSITFQTSPDGVNWTALGTPTTGIATSTFKADGTASNPCYIVPTASSLGVLTGKVYKMQASDLAGTYQANVDFTAGTASPVPDTSVSGQVWTVYSPDAVS